VVARRLAALKGDGNLEAWKGATVTRLGGENVSRQFGGRNWRGDDDLTAEVRLGWNERGLGVSVLVRDDTAVFPKDFSDVWNYDSLQLYLDPLGDATKAAPNKGDDAEWLVAWLEGKTARAYLLHAPSGRYLGADNLTVGLDGDVKVTCRRLDDGGLFYDIFIPAACLPRLRCEKGGALGFSLLINDNDGEGRKTGLTLAPKHTHPVDAPHLFRNILLEE
jgi:hypothetical protein